MRRPIQFHLAVFALMLAGACGGNTPPDTSPTTETGVVGGSLLMPPGEPFAPGVTVRVVGTSVSADVDSFGRFVLPNVPAGPLNLHFTGSGLGFGLEAGDIAGGETVTLTVRVETSALRIEAIARVRGSDATIEGVIEASGASGDTLPPNTIIVGGRSVQLPAGTAANLKPGMRVRATGTVSAAGIIARDLTIL